MLPFKSSNDSLFSILEVLVALVFLMIVWIWLITYLLPCRALPLLLGLAPPSPAAVLHLWVFVVLYPMAADEVEVDPTIAWFA